jgi:hypothetical protein
MATVRADGDGYDNGQREGQRQQHWLTATQWRQWQKWVTATAMAMADGSGNGNGQWAMGDGDSNGDGD